MEIFKPKELCNKNKKGENNVFQPTEGIVKPSIIIDSKRSQVARLPSIAKVLNKVIEVGIGV